jgi:hypothetical protein
VVWLVRLFNMFMNLGGAPLEWRCAIIVPQFMGKVDKKESNNSEG